MPRPAPRTPGVTVLGNLAVDRIDGAAPSAGGCPSFVGPALVALGEGRVVTRAAPADLPLFAEVIAASGVPVDVLPATRTSGFGLHYDGDQRTMSVDAIGPIWGRGEIAAARVTTDWVHVAPLLRTDFPPTALAALAADGHRIAYDGQGLVRSAEMGPLTTDADYDPALLEHLTVLKLGDDEAAALTSGEIDQAFADRLGVPELLVTYGSQGCRVFADGQVHDVPSAWKVEGIHMTGAGDMFLVSYVAARARGDAPVEAAKAAALIVAELLQVRLESLA